MTINLAGLTAHLDARLAAADQQLASQFPGSAGRRQPVHTVYVAGHLFHAGLPREWGDQALSAASALTGADFADSFGVPATMADDVRTRVLAKLEREPIEDLRVDFEDGFGNRGDEAEDAAVERAAAELLRAVDEGVAPPSFGIRFKCFETPTRARGLRTLARMVELLTRDGRLPEGFVVTLPKVTSVDQVEAMVYAAGQIEDALGLAQRALRFEIQVETPQAILGPDGTALVARMIHAGDARVTSLHYGTYDYSASCGIAAAYQSLEHPVADYAKGVMQVAAAGTGVTLSDGSTNVIPVGDADQVRAAWQLHSRLVRRSLERGYYQGWDLHPAHLPSRFAATFAFYRHSLHSAAERLRNYLQQRESAIMDEPATAWALADYVARALDCGATDSAEVAELSEVGRDDIYRLARRPVG